MHVFTAVTTIGRRGWKGGGHTATARAKHQESAEKPGKKHPFGTDEQHHAQARVVDRRLRLIITAIAIVAEGGLRKGRWGGLGTLNKLRHFHNERICIAD